MAYFTAVLARDGAAWRSLDVDLEDAVDVDDVTEEVRELAGEGGPLLVVLEREDDWFALVRADGEDPRVFVSDLAAVQGSRYAELLALAADAPAPVPAPREDAEDSAVAVAAPTWAGDVGLLADLGVDGDDLTGAAESSDTSTALALVGERCGFVELLEALR